MAIALILVCLYFLQSQAKFEQFSKQQGQFLQSMQDQSQRGLTDVRQQLMEILSHNIDILTKQVDRLSLTTTEQLARINQQLEQRLTEGLNKTTETFTDIIKRLALIDEAQKKMSDLSNEVVGLQRLLADKRARGAFGEAQLEALIQDVLPPNKYAFQHTLSNGKRADCVLILPKPTGMIAIDSKFPLENYQFLQQPDLSKAEQEHYQKRFRQDVLKHIQDIAEKYIIPNETADSAMMFIPSEAIFAEIYGHLPDVVDESHRKRIWLVSPTTMMAVLTTAHAVIKDEITRKQVHVIREHLVGLAKDFSRFEQRMDKLATHIKQAQNDVDEVQTSAKKITSRFQKIEKVEIEQIEHKEEVEMV